MARKTTKPTKDDIIERATLARTYWAPLHAEMEEDYTRFEDKQVIVAPKGYNIRRLGTARTIVTTAADHIAGDFPQIKVPEASLSKRAQDRTERLEKAFQASLFRFLQERAENIIRTLVVNGLWSGMMVSKGPIFDPDVWGEIPVNADGLEDYERDKRINWPFFWAAIDPRYVFPDPGTTGKQWVVVEYQRTVGDIKSQWAWDGRLPGVSKRDKPLTDDTKVTWTEYWDRSYRAYLVGGDLIDDIRPHRYGKPPFQIRSAGYGTDSGLPHERFRSIIYPARALLDQEIATASQLDAIMRRTAWPIVLTPHGSGFDTLEPGTVKEMTGEHIQNTKTFTELEPQIVQALLQEREAISAQIEEATFPKVVQGIRAKGVTSGFGQNSLVAQAKVKYGAAVVNLSSLLSEFFVDYARCIQHVVREDVPIWGRTRWGVVDSVIKPDDVDDLRHVEVVVNPKLPTDRANEVAIGQILLGLGAIDLDTFISEYAGYEQPGEMRVKVMRDRALASPEIQRVLSLAAAMESGYIDYVMDLAVKMGMDPGLLLNALGFGSPQQQTPTNQIGGQPENVAPQLAAPNQSLMGFANKTQPAPGSQSAVRDAAVPGVPIR